MLTVYSEDHALQDGKAELVDGKLVPCFEMPRRAFLIRDRVLEVGLGAIVPPRAVRPRRRSSACTAPDFVDVPGHAPGSGGRRPAATTTPCRGCGRPGTLRQVRPERIDGQIGYYSFDAGTPITAGTWRAAQASADVALTAAKLLADGRQRAVFALCRPPGPPCRGRSLWRLLLPQQRRDRRAVPARRRRRAGGDPRRRLPPRQRHPGDLLRPRRRAVPVAARRSARGVSRSSWAGPTRRGDRRRARASTSTIRCPGAPAFRPGRRRSRTPARESPTTRRTCSLVSLGVDTFKDDPISQVQARERRTSPPTAAGSPGSACRPCS